MVQNVWGSATTKIFSGPRKAGTTNHVALAGQRKTRGAVEIAETNATIGEARHLFAVSGVTMKPYLVLFSALMAVPAGRWPRRRPSGRC